MPDPDRLTCKGGGLLTSTIRVAAALTTSYVITDSLYIEGADNIALLVSFTLGNSSGCRIKVEFSTDNDVWYQQTNYSTSGSDEIYIPITLKLESTMDIQIDFPVANKYMKLSCVALGSGNGTSLSIGVVQSNL